VISWGFSVDFPKLLCGWLPADRFIAIPPSIALFAEAAALELPIESVTLVHSKASASIQKQRTFNFLAGLWNSSYRTIFCQCTSSIKLMDLRLPMVWQKWPDFAFRFPSNINFIMESLITWRGSLCDAKVSLPADPEKIR